MKRATISIHLLLASLLLVAGSALGQQLLDRIVAVVNDSVITASELADRVRQVRDQLRTSGSPLPPGPVFERQVLERMVVEEIQVQMATRNGLAVDDVELNNTLRNIARRNNLNLIEFREILARDGYDFNVYREQIRREMMIARLRERQVANRVTVSDQEVDHFLQREAAFADKNVEYRLAHILIAIPEGSSAERIQQAKEKIEALRRQVESGADFTALAIAESDGQQALQGGDLGWRKAGQIPQLFGETALKLGVGETSVPIRSPSGFHLIKLVDKRGDRSQIVTQSRARHILIKTNAIVSPNEARERLRRLRTRIVNGEPFEALARANSEDPRSATEGGDLGWISPGQLVPQFEEAMAQLQPGELSGPVQSQFGWHLIQLLERRQEDVTEEVKRNQARQTLYRRKVEEETLLWMQRMRDESYVEYRTDS